MSVWNIRGTKEDNVNSDLQTPDEGGWENGEGWENKLIHTYEATMRFQGQAAGHLTVFLL